MDKRTLIYFTFAIGVMLFSGLGIASAYHNTYGYSNSYSKETNCDHYSCTKTISSHNPYRSYYSYTETSNHPYHNAVYSWAKYGPSYYGGYYNSYPTYRDYFSTSYYNRPYQRYGGYW